MVAEGVHNSDCTAACRGSENLTDFAEFPPAPSDRDSACQADCNRWAGGSVSSIASAYVHSEMHSTAEVPTSAFMKLFEDAPARLEAGLGTPSGWKHPPTHRQVAPADAGGCIAPMQQLGLGELRSQLMRQPVPHTPPMDAKTTHISPSVAQCATPQPLFPMHEMRHGPETCQHLRPIERTVDLWNSLAHL